MNIAAYIVRRLFFMVFVLFGVLIITFAVSHVVPADPVGAILGPQAPLELIEKINREWGFDKPLYEQFILYVQNLLQGNLGKSIRTNNPVLEDIIHYWPATIELSTTALLFALAIGLPTGIISALKRNKVVDHIVRVFSITGLSMPVFWLGLMLLYALYFRLELLPGIGRLDIVLTPPPRVTGLYTIDSLIHGDLDAFVNVLRHLVMPAFVLGFSAAGSIARITRASMLEVMRQEYVNTARAKGLKERVVIMRHILRNSLITPITVIGMIYGGLLEGSILTETIFAWPGLGRYATGSFMFLDFQAVMGVTLFLGVIYSLANLIVDVMYAYLDPRVRI
ncbi:MAG: ABC transporter permease [Candidatus Bathyarchaeia archaeon]